MSENFSKFPPFLPKKVVPHNDNNVNHEAEINVQSTNTTSFFIQSSPSSTTLIRDDERVKIHNSFISKLLKNPKLNVIDPHLVKYDQNHSVGSGSFGDIFAGSYVSIPVAVKKHRFFSIYNDKDVNYQFHESRLIKEINTLADMNFPKFNQFFGVFIDKNTGEVLTVHDLAQNSLKNILEEGQIPNEKKDWYAKQILEIVEFLIVKGIIDKDLAPKNFLIKKNGELEICDFGDASRLGEGEIMRLTGIQYTPIYAPPEFFIQKGIFPTSDIWSLGIILYKIYYGKNFWCMKEQHKYIEELRAQKIKTLNPTVAEDPICSSKITDIIRGCLHHDPNQRITIKRIWEIFNSYSSQF